VNFGEGLGLRNKQIDRVFNRFKKNNSAMIKMIQNSFLSKKMETAYTEVLE